MSTPGPRVEKVVLADKLDLVREHWSPRVVAELNGQHVRVAKLLGLGFEFRRGEQG